VSVHAAIPLLCVLAPTLISAAPPGLSFEPVARMSERIVLARVLGPDGARVSMVDGTKIALGVKDSATGLVFTPWRIRVDDCLLDLDGDCAPGEDEVFTPGGTVYENVEGRETLRTWEVRGAAGTPLPVVGSDVVLFMTKRSGRYFPINDPAARLIVGGSPGARTVVLRFASPRLLSDAARTGSAFKPHLTESVSIERLKSIIASVRAVLKPTSGSDHAPPDSGASRDDAAVRKSRTGVHTGQDADRR
jgi:hypothetical protein